MKKAITAILLGLIVSMYSCARKLTVMSYNVHHCEGMDNKVDEERIARIISVNQPDVVAIQELDSVTKRCPAYQLQVLGEKTGMYYTYAKSIDYGGGKYGIGILSKERPICVKRIPLPGAEPRVLLICEFHDYYYACTHLCLKAVNRIKSLSIILQQAELADKPFFIAGDWNALPQEEFIQGMNHHFDYISNKQISTFPSDHPKRCIDYIAFYRASIKKSIKVKKYTVLSEPVASDHCPIKATVNIK